MKTKTFETENPSWKPIRRGHIYCAPACGGNCTWVAYQSALQSAKTLAERMGPGWKGEVWENMGWHYKAVGYDGRANIHVHTYPGEKPSYTAFLSKQPSCGGDWAESAGSPEAALDIVLKQARIEFDQLAKLFIEVSKHKPRRLLQDKLATSPNLTAALKALLLP